MPFWRRKPLHERLAQEGGLVERPEPTLPSWDQAGVHGLSRPRRWDAVATVEAPGIDGDERDFVLLADGTLIGEESDTPLAEALGLEPPFRAQAVRRGGDLWAVAANRITVVQLDVDPGGDTIDLAMREGERTVLVDGARSFGSVPALEQLLDGDGVAHAERLDETLWAVTVAPL
jgi:hypothetical protein